MKILRPVAWLLLVFGILLIHSCNIDDAPRSPPPLGNWVNSMAFHGVPRAGAVSFAIGTKAFVGTGYDGTFYQNDWYSYDAVLQRWLPIAAFPGLPREQAVAFSLNGIGYVGLGYNRDSVSYLKDFWKYDPSTDTWTQLNDFGGKGLTDAVAFDDGTNGYVGTGYDLNYYADFWKYDPGADSWTLIPIFPGDKRRSAMTMTINGKTYLFGGQNNGSFTYDIWEFDPTQINSTEGPWTDRTPPTTDAQYNNFKAAVSRYDACTFTLDGKGYISCGSNGQILSITWQYDPTLGTYGVYRQMQPFVRAPRSQAVAFVIGESGKLKAFVTTGVQGTSHFNDMMEFRPLENQQW